MKRDLESPPTVSAPATVQKRKGSDAVIVGKSTTTVEQADSVSALERGFAVLRCFTVDTPALSHQEITRLTGLAKATITRIIQSLVKLGYLETSHVDSKLRLAPELLRFSHVYLSHLDIRAVARPHMVDLAFQTRATVSLATPNGDSLSVIETCRSPLAVVSINVQLGYQFPIFKTAIGRAYMAGLAPNEKAALLDRHHPSSDSTSLAAGLKTAQNEVAKYGFCVMQGEWRNGINAVAAPVRAGPGGHVFAINCAGPALDLPRQTLLKEIGPSLLAVVQKIEKSFGQSS